MDICSTLRLNKGSGLLDQIRGKKASHEVVSAPFFIDEFVAAHNPPSESPGPFPPVHQPPTFVIVLGAVVAPTVEGVSELEQANEAADV